MTGHSCARLILSSRRAPQGSQARPRRRAPRFLQGAGSDRLLLDRQGADHGDGGVDLGLPRPQPGARDRRRPRRHRLRRSRSTCSSRRDRYVPWAYWLAVAMVGVFGTMAADVLHVGLGVPYIASTIFYAIVLAVVFRTWYRQRGNALDPQHHHPSAASSSTGPRSSPPSRSAPRPATSPPSPSASATSARSCSSPAIIAIPAIGYFRFGMNSILAFWFAYVRHPPARRLGRRLARGLLRPRRPRPRHRPGQPRPRRDDRRLRLLPLADRQGHAARPGSGSFFHPRSRGGRSPLRWSRPGHGAGLTAAQVMAVKRLTGGPQACQAQGQNRSPYSRRWPAPASAGRGAGRRG